VLCFIVAGFASPAWATIDNLKTYKAAYPDKPPKDISCKTCHQSPIGRKDNLNEYGQALQHFKAPADAKRLALEDFKALDEDPDQDGASTLQELLAGTDPVDPNSVPPPPEQAPASPAGSESAPAPESQSPPPPPGSSQAVPDPLRAYLQTLVNATAWAEETEGSAAADAPAQAEYVGTETCAACHATQYKEFMQSTHARISVPGDTHHAQGCEMCHGPGSLHVAAGGGRGVGGIINPRKDPSTCFACHLDKKAEFQLPYHHPVMEGKMSCADCHNPHAPDVRPWSATTLKDVNEACFRCHKEQRGPFVWEHEALREGCVTCHKVHGSIHEKMLLVRDNNLCLRCHTQANFPTIGKSSHAGRLPQGTCFSAGCHTAIHGSNFDDHLRY